MLTLIVFLLILSILVLVHELGHFVAAKKMGIEVEEFGFGLPPKVFGRKFRGTEYTLNLLPFGGFVKLLGEEELDSSTNPRHFMSKSPLKRGVVLVAGVFMNIILAIALYYLFFFLNGYRTLAIPQFFDYQFRFGEGDSINTVVTGFSEDSPALLAEIEPGEAVIEIDSVPVYSVSDVREQLSTKEGDEVKLLLLDVRSVDKDLRSVSLTPMVGEDGSVLIGVILSKAVTLDYSKTKLTSGIKHAYNMVSYSGFTFSKLISSAFATKSIQPVSSSVAGPVGIFSVVGGILTYSGKEAVLGIIDLLALFSISLAILNILPFPALDGGRLIFVFIEALRGGKRVSSSFEAAIHKWGMVFLLGLLLLITFKDVVNLFAS